MEIVGIQQLEPDRGAGDPHPYTVVVPVYDETLAAWTVEVALSLVRAHGGRVVLLGIVRVPVEESLSTGAGEARSVRALLARLQERFAGEPIVVKPRTRVVYEARRALGRVVRSEHAHAVVLPWEREDERQLFAESIDTVLSYLDCDVVVVHGVPERKINQLLLPLRGSAEAPLTLEVALSLSTRLRANITMLNAPGEEDASGRQMYAELARISQGYRWVKKEIRVNEELVSAILARKAEHDLVVLGVAEAEPQSERRMVGPVARRLRHEGNIPLIVVKSHSARLPHDPQVRREQAELTPTPASVLVDQWFAENTFSSEEYEDIEKLVTLKEQQGLTISLGLPALNEEETVGKVIRTVQETLVERFPLLDEVVLIDSGSTDDTVAIAQDLGIPVYAHSQILPRYGTHHGKGEALWKSLYVLKGDLIAWIDTDIVNIHPRFIYGILGPLLQRSDIQYVKGYYRRPLRVGDKLQAGGGGRVTELVARPLINLFYPELSGIVQPLSGEYAGRRAALEQVPFYSGYGVETGLLLDLVERYGISGIAQVDLLNRVHHNQTLGALSRMAFAIIQVFIEHLERRQKVGLLSEINQTMKIINYDGGRFSLNEQTIHDESRPPMMTLPEYRARHKAEDDQPSSLREVVP